MAVRAICDPPGIGASMSQVLGFSEVFMVVPSLFMKDVLPGELLFSFFFFSFMLVFFGPSRSHLFSWLEVF